MPQDQRYGRRSSRSDWDDERNREYGYGRDDWRGESRSYRSRRYEDEGGGYGHDRRQDRDYQGTLRAGDYGRYEEEEDRSYPERYGRERGYGGEYGSQDFGRESGRGGEYGRGGYGGEYGRGGYGSSYGAREYGSMNRSGRRDYGGGGGGYGYYGGSYASGGGNYGQGGGGFGSYTRDYERNYGRGSAYGGNRDYGRRENRGYEGRGSGNRQRDWWDRATDEVSSWFGDEDAERRRQMDEHRGRGPKNYSRSDDRIREDVSDRLTDDPLVDASDIDVGVSSQEVTLSGTVSTRQQKRLAEDCAEMVSGVKHVQNNLRVKGRDWSHTGQSSTGDISGTSGSYGSSSTTNR